LRGLLPFQPVHERPLQFPAYIPTHPALLHPTLRLASNLLNLLAGAHPSGHPSGPLFCRSSTGRPGPHQVDSAYVQTCGRALLRTPTCTGSRATSMSRWQGAFVLQSMKSYAACAPSFTDSSTAAPCKLAATWSPGATPQVPSTAAAAHDYLAKDQLNSGHTPSPQSTPTPPTPQAVRTRPGPGNRVRSRCCPMSSRTACGRVPTRRQHGCTMQPGHYLEPRDNPSGPLHCSSSARPPYQHLLNSAHTPSPQSTLRTPTCAGSRDTSMSRYHGAFLLPSMASYAARRC
jgi:hypothetical protein